MPATSAAVLQQILPLFILILLPALALRIFSFVRLRFRAPSMALGALLPWNWGHSGHSPHEKELEHGKERRVRTRAGQVAENKKKLNEKSPGLGVDSDAHFPGLVNMSGTHCFMNSTLQALASLSGLSPYLLAIRTRAEALDVPTPVVDASLTSSPRSTPPPPPPSAPSLLSRPSVRRLLPSIRPSASSSSLTSAFWDAPRGASTTSNASAKAAALLASHEHQDAQELFQLLSECVRERARASDGRSPFDGLTATRRACVRCGYTAAIRHFAFDSVQLALESAGGGWGGTTLPALLRAYTALEVLHDCACRRCALRATARRLQEEIAKLEAPSVNGGAMVNGMIVTAGGSANGLIANGHSHANGETSLELHADSDNEHADEGSQDSEEKGVDSAGAPTASRLRRLKAVRRMETRVRRALEAGRIEEEELQGEWEWGDGDGGGEGQGGATLTLKGTGDALKGVRIEKVPGGVSTLNPRLHINRSVHTGMRVAKNGARVAFPEILNLAPYTTGGVLNLDPTAALSGSLDSHIAFPTGSDPDTPTPTPANGEECLYRLAAAVCHYGQHSFGHYICYRRAPVPSSSLPPSSASSSLPGAEYVPAPPTREGTAGTGTGWLRISDARVDRCGVERCSRKGSAVFMLYYERVPPPPPPQLPPSSFFLSLVPSSLAGGGVHGRLGGDTAAGHFGGAGLSSGVSRELATSMGASAGLAGLAGSGIWGLGAEGVRERACRASVSSSSLSSSSLSLRSVSSTSPSSSPSATPAPSTPRARAADVDARAAEVEVEVLALEGDGAEGNDHGDGEDDNDNDNATALPTPPPTPRSSSEPPAVSPKAKKKKKKKGPKQEALVQAQAISVN
ncbi:hypothetical protein B0H13DRAFT_2656774 [Mycena leptocephala]|nr:hypothetical protein B0H13DRAFT_2656774 [Mycena leptocephala]